MKVNLKMDLKKDMELYIIKMEIYIMKVNLKIINLNFMEPFML